MTIDDEKLEEMEAPMADVDTDEMRGIIEYQRERHGSSPMLERIEELVDAVDQLRDELAPVDCPACEGGGGSVGYYGEFSVCTRCDGGGDVSPCDAVRIEERIRARNAYFGLLGEKEEADRMITKWQSCAVTAVERMTGRTWDDDPEGISPGQLASIAAGSVPRRELGEVMCERDRYREALEAADEADTMSTSKHRATRVYIDADGDLVDVEDTSIELTMGINIPASIVVRPPIHADTSRIEGEEGTRVLGRAMIQVTSPRGEAYAKHVARMYLEDNLTAVRSMEPMVLIMEAAND